MHKTIVVKYNALLYFTGDLTQQWILNNLRDRRNLTAQPVIVPLNIIFQWLITYEARINYHRFSLLRRPQITAKRKFSSVWNSRRTMSGEASLRYIVRDARPTEKKKKK